MRSRIYPECMDQSTCPNLHAHVMSNENKFPLNKAWLEAFRARIFENSRVVKEARERVQTTHRMLVSSYKVRRCVSHRHTYSTYLITFGPPTPGCSFSSSPPVVVHVPDKSDNEAKTTHRNVHGTGTRKPLKREHTHYLCYITPQDAI